MANFDDGNPEDCPDFFIWFEFGKFVVPCDEKRQKHEDPISGKLQRLKKPDSCSCGAEV